jgi:hypothetical protein
MLGDAGGAKHMEHPGNLLASLLMGNTIANILLGVVLGRSRAKIISSNRLLLPQALSFPCSR